MADGGVSLYIMLAATAATAYVQYEQGQATADEYKDRQEEEKMAARDREIARRNRLIKALASRNVASAASGTSLEGTDIALINKDFRDYSSDSLTDAAMTKKRVRSLGQQASAARRIGTLSAGTTLLGGASRLSSPGGGSMAVKGPNTKPLGVIKN